MFLCRLSRLSPRRIGMTEKSSLKILDSRITAVTVYTDRAQVKRRAELDLKAGEHKLTFDNLPPGLDPDSLQVNGEGKAILSDMRFRQENFSEIPDEEVRKIIEHKKNLERSIREIDDGLALAQKEKAYIDGILQKLITPAKKQNEKEQDPQNWIEMMAFYRERQTGLDKEIRNHESERETVSADLAKTQKDIQSLSGRRSRTRNLVEVIINMEKEGHLALTLSYIIHGPSWTPVYDIRVSSSDKSLTLGYNALVRQNTTESWDDIELSLSTAQVQLYGRQPELSPWYLDIWQAPPAPAPARGMMGSGAGSPRMKMAKMQAVSNPPQEREEDMFSDAEEAMPEMEVPAVSVESGASSVLFTLQTSTSVPGDGNPQKVSILNQSLPARFEYSTVPKLSPHAFLKAIIENKTEYPLLKGKSNIFLDNAFVAKADMDTVAPGEEFKTFLGVDESIKVEYKFLKKYQKDEGIIGRKNRELYDYLVILNNHKKTDEKIIVQDQIPLSRHQDIEVKLLEPVYKQDTDLLKKKDYEILEWTLTLKAGEKKEIPLKWAVDCPRDTRITGL